MSGAPQTMLTRKLIPFLTTDVITEFWNSVDICEPDECWPWLKGINGAGYGQLNIGSSIGSRRVTAHRVAWSIANDKEPGKLVICHECDNPPCCNPYHLFAASHRANQYDAVLKGRKGKKLRKHDTLFVQLLFWKAGLTAQQISKLLGVHYSYIRRIVERCR